MTVSEPATTCALDITRLGDDDETAALEHPLATRCHAPDLQHARWMRGDHGIRRQTGSGTSTLTMGVRPNGRKTSGSPEVSTNLLRLAGSSLVIQAGATLSTPVSTREPRTAAARFG